MDAPHQHPIQPPSFIYGTAWKEERTEELTGLALAEGFRAIDTANQRKHYDEVGVGRALERAFEGGLGREEVFVQSKFTYRAGQDERLPYDPRAPAPEQVQQSFASSLEHLGCSYLDSYLLHAPERSHGLSFNDWQVWKTMSELQEAAKVRSIGVSNVSFQQLRALCEGSEVRPNYVQNRCYATQGWDLDVRLLCAKWGIVYQGFSLLTANRPWLRSGAVGQVARRLGVSPCELAFCFARHLKILPLTGTRQATHMRQDLGCVGYALRPEDVRSLMHEVTAADEI